MGWMSLSESMFMMYRNYGVWAMDFFAIILIAKHNYYIHYLLQVSLH